MEQVPAVKDTVDAVLYVVVGSVLTYFFFTPIKETVTEAVRPSVEWVLGEHE